MIKLFAKYFSIGIINTAIHWSVFGALTIIFSTTQATANLLGFITAVSFSFFANAKFTFKAKATTARYLSFTLFMGLLSYLTGYIADQLRFPPIATLIIFSSISLVLGFLYSKIFVFRNTPQ
ncbi:MULTISPECIES: GtrA family protein [Providencia]|uniref:GtrA family protein n=1 Tax=Providencia TaxID=586 RepID=UPI00198146CA|nr:MULTISPECIES: GtrA family protein [Providencia]MBN4863487.1 GtrA family protein [Providencia stuartii]MBN4872809.1 GtrA family protein [Providencia stuartii]MBN4878070.1 GtrA family protein [Providencia stuartii]MBN4882010.1 GtrA family protein [Providencia stuartii]